MVDEWNFSKLMIALFSKSRNLIRISSQNCVLNTLLLQHLCQWKFYSTKFFVDGINVGIKSSGKVLLEFEVFLIRNLTKNCGCIFKNCYLIQALIFFSTRFFQPFSARNSLKISTRNCIKNAKSMKISIFLQQLGLLT